MGDKRDWPDDASAGPVGGEDVGQYGGLHRLTELERARIQSTNQRNDVARYALELDDLADKRNFDFEMAQLQARIKSADRRFELARTIVTLCCSGGFCLGALLLYMAFFGTAVQSQTALLILKALGLGVAGYGVIGAFVRAISVLLDRWSRGE